MILEAPKLIGLPPAPTNGGPLGLTTPRKVGEWVWQPKVDGWRGVLHAPSGTIWNQYGQLSSIADKFRPALEVVRDRTERFADACEWLDVELMENRHDLMRGCIIVLDLMFPKLTLLHRRAIMLATGIAELPADVAAMLELAGGQVRDSAFVINQWDDVTTNEYAVNRQEWLQKQNAAIGHKFFEGTVAKRLHSFYRLGQTPKTKTADHIKHRFDQGL